MAVTYPTISNLIIEYVKIGILSQNQSETNLKS